MRHSNLATATTRAINVKITAKGLKSLRLVSAYTGESQYEVLERVLDAEFRKVQKEEAENDTTS